MPGYQPLINKIPLMKNPSFPGSQQSPPQGMVIDTAGQNVARFQLQPKTSIENSLLQQQMKDTKEAGKDRCQRKNRCSIDYHLEDEKPDAEKAPNANLSQGNLMTLNEMMNTEAKFRVRPYSELSRDEANG